MKKKKKPYIKVKEIINVIYMSAVLRPVQAKSKILSKLFHLVSGSEGPTTPSYLLAKGCAVAAVLKMSPWPNFPPKAPDT